MKSIARILLLTVATALAATGAAAANEVTDWNQILFQAALAAVPPTSPLVITRVAAIVEVSVFDAVNGVTGKYTPIHVAPAAPHGTSRRAAAVQAAYATLSFFYPAQQAMLDAQRTASLAAIHTGKKAKDNGIAWGQTVADAILAWRSTDGFVPPPPPFTGGTNPGQWRPTPPAFLPGAGPQFATMVPWVIESPDQFRPAGPPALDSARYAADVAETGLMGSLTSPARTSDQTLFSQFWAASTAPYYWNQIALSLDHQHRGLVRKARLMALVNVALADAAIACWDAKYTYVFWRPITAIGTVDPTWTPLLTTPNHPEYPSGHSTVSSAAAEVLRDFFGEDSAFSVTSDVMLGVERSFPNFSSALDEIKNARIYAGIHFRSACDDGQATGASVGDYVLAHAAQPARAVGGDDDDNDD
jgi:hypothetical protein